MRPILHILAILLTTLIYGCIGPIHYGTAIHGNVLTESEQPLQNAEVILYGVKTEKDKETERLLHSEVYNSSIGYRLLFHSLTPLNSPMTEFVSLVLRT